MYTLHLIVVNHTYKLKFSQDILFDEILVKSNTTQNQVCNSENAQAKENIILLTTGNTNSSENNNEVIKFILNIYIYYFYLILFIT